MGKEKMPGNYPKLLIFLTMALVLLACWGCTYVSDPYEEVSPLKLTVLDVGQGLSVLLEYDGRFALYDAGPDSVGVLDTLLHRGIDTLDWILVSHNHRDHGGGFMELPAFLESGRLHVGRLYVGPDTAGGIIRDSILKVARWYDIPVDTLVRGRRLGFGRRGAVVGSAAASDQIVVAASGAVGPMDCTAAGTVAAAGTLAAGGTAVEGPELQVLWPPDYEHVAENTSSLVLAVRFGEATALLTGDLDSLGERKLLELSPTLTADLLQVGHHGSGGSSTLGFLSQVSPRSAVVSVGAGNRYGHPAKSVLQKLHYVMGDLSDIYRTDRDGSVSFYLYHNLGVIPP